MEEVIRTNEKLGNYGTKDEILQLVRKASLPKTRFMRIETDYRKYENDDCFGGELILTNYMAVDDESQPFVYPVKFESDTKQEKGYGSDNTMYVSAKDFPVLLKIMTAQQAGEMAMWLIQKEEMEGTGDGLHTLDLFNGDDENFKLFVYNAQLIYDKLCEIERSI